MTNAKLNIWVIYYDAIDKPNLFTARQFILNQPTNNCFSVGSLDQCRAWVKAESVKCGMIADHRMARDAKDDVKIVECWL